MSQEIKNRIDNQVNPFTNVRPKVIGDIIKELSDEVDLKQDLLTFDNIPTDGSINPVTSEGIKDYVDDAVAGITFNIASDADLETQTTPVEDNELVSKHGLIFWWNWIKTQAVNITARWQFNGIGLGKTAEVSSYLDIAPNTTAVAQTVLNPSTTDYTGTREGATWNNNGEIKFIDTGGLVNRQVKIYNNELLKGSNNRALEVNQYGDISAVDPIYEAVVSDSEIISALENSSGWNEAVKTISTTNPLLLGQEYFSYTTRYYYKAVADNVAIRYPIRDNRACTITVEVPTSGSTYQNDTLIGASMIHYIIINNSMVQYDGSTYTFDGTTGTLTFNVTVGDFLTINYT